MEEYVNNLVENTLKKENAKEIIVERILWYEMKLLEKDEEIERLNNIINKGIEHIEEKVGNEIHDMMYVIDVSDLLDILKGE